jgi:hypothetical protein
MLQVIIDDLNDLRKILLLRCLVLFIIRLWFLRFFELLKSLLEFSNIESLVGVEVAYFKSFGERLFLLEDAVDSLAAVRLARSLVLFFHYNIINLKPYELSHSPESALRCDLKELLLEHMSQDIPHIFFQG